MTQYEARAANRHDDAAEITIHSDGRIYVFGLSRELLEILQALAPANRELRQRADLARIPAIPDTPPPAVGP